MEPRAHRTWAAGTGVSDSSGGVTDSLKRISILAFIYPIPHVMSVALSFRYLNYGHTRGTRASHSRFRSLQTGSFTNSTRILAATFAAPFGDRLAFGLSLKILAVDFSSTGLDPNRASESSRYRGARHWRPVYPDEGFAVRDRRDDSQCWTSAPD